LQQRPAPPATAPLLPALAEGRDSPRLQVR